MGGRDEMKKTSSERVSDEGQTTREECIKRPRTGPLPARVTRTDTGIGLQDLRERIYAKAKAEPSWRFWGLYTHVCKMDVLREAYRMAKRNNGAPGIDGVTFEAIEEAGVEEFLGRIREELVSGTYRPMRNRRKEIPKGNGKVRVLGIPTIRDRVVQGALKLILEPIFEADFQDGSYGYRPGRKPHDAIERVARAIAEGKTKVVDVDLRSYFDNVRHHLILEKVARRVDDARVMHLLKAMLRASGKKGVPQGGVISPLMANLYLDEADRMLEDLRDETSTGRFTHVEYARFADDIVILVDGYERYGWLLDKVQKRLNEELGKVEVELNREKSRLVDLAQGESFTFLGFEFRRVKSRRGKWRPDYRPKSKARAELTRKVTEICRRNRSRPVAKLISEINPVVRGWVNYFRAGNSSRCFSYIRYWVERKVRRQMMRARKRKGFGWKRWSSRWIHEVLGLFDDYRIRYHRGESVPDRWVT
jgi:RNA-directed DNA polymerase